MNWYKIIKLASPRNKIQSLEINDPFYQAFIYKYEDQIPWHKIDTEVELRSFIIDLFKSSIDKEIKELPEGETKTILDNWADLVEWGFSGTNYARDYLVMKPLLDYAKTHTAPPPVAMPDTVTPIVNEIAENPSASINFLREYRRNMNPMPREDGWHFFPQGSNPHSLYLFTQGGGWCLSTKKYAKSYLDDGNIRIYSQNNVPIIAMTDDGSGNLNEIRGRFNKLPYEYADIVDEKVEQLNLNTENSSFYTMVIGLSEVIERLSKNPSDEMALNALEDLLDIRLYGEGYVAYRDLPPSIKSSPPVREKIKDHLERYIDNFPDDVSRGISRISENVQDDFLDFLAEKTQKAIKDGVPVKTWNFSERFWNKIKEKIDIKQLANNWISEVIKNGQGLFNFPSELLAVLSDEQIASLIVIVHNSNFRNVFSSIAGVIEKDRRDNIYNIINKQKTPEEQKLYGILEYITKKYRESMHLANASLGPVYDFRPIFQQLNNEERKWIMQSTRKMIATMASFHIYGEIEESNDRRSGERAVPLYIPREMVNYIKREIERKSQDSTTPSGYLPKFDIIEY